MTARRGPPRNGRKAFKGLAPKGYTIRMMEPGDAPALLECVQIGAVDAPGHGAIVRKPTVDIHEFTRFLLSHEVFVAVAKADGRPAGFAAAAAESDLYWISALCVRTAHEDDRIADAMLAAVAQRAHWFFYRALGLSVTSDAVRSAAFYETNGFLRIPHGDLPQWLDDKRRADAADSETDNQIVMLKWL